MVGNQRTKKIPSHTEHVENLHLKSELSNLNSSLNQGHWRCGATMLSAALPYFCLFVCLLMLCTIWTAFHFSLLHVDLCYIRQGLPARIIFCSEVRPTLTPLLHSTLYIVTSTNHFVNTAPCPIKRFNEKITQQCKNMGKVGKLHADIAHSWENIVHSPCFACGILLMSMTQFFGVLLGLFLAHSVHTFSGNLKRDSYRCYCWDHQLAVNIVYILLVWPQ